MGTALSLNQQTIILSTCAVFLGLNIADQTCTSITNGDTCQILLDTTYDTANDGDIICDSNYQNCIIDCVDQKKSCGNTIYCPHNGSYCQINCQFVCDSDLMFLCLSLLTYSVCCTSFIKYTERIMPRCYSTIK